MPSIPAIIVALFITSSLWVFPKPVEAACNFHTLMTSTTKDISNFTSTCTITDVEGVDNPINVESSTTNAAGITIGSGSSVTINNGGSLVTNSLVLNGGTLAIQTGGQAKINAPVYITDADADGWPDSWTLYTATASGRRRLGLMRSFGTLDCNGSSYSATNSCCTVATRYQDADGDGYGNPNVSISACTTAGYVDNNADCDDTNTSIRTTNITGGTITTSGSDKIHTFTSSGTLSVVCGTTSSAEILLVGGGGGGAHGLWDNSGTLRGGGGGAGGVALKTGVALNSSYTVTVGAGGAASSNGANTTFGSLYTANGGGKGGSTNGSNGGSGGGGASYWSVSLDQYSNGSRGTATQPTSPTGGYGNHGANPFESIPGAGGGAGGAAGGTTGGPGITIWGVVYGIGGNANQTAVNGRVNKGDGGSGAPNGNKNVVNAGGAGGSGIVIVRYANP